MEHNLELPIHTQYEDALLEISRKLTSQERSNLSMIMTQLMRDATTAALKWCHPNASEEEIGVLMVSHYGQELGDRFKQHLIEHKRGKAEASKSDVSGHEEI